MEHRDSKEQMDNPEPARVDKSTGTNSGNPNVVDPTEERTTEHKGGYGGEGGRPRTSSDERQKIDEE